MPTFVVTDPNTGQKVRLTGDSPPTEQELNEIFSSLPQQQTPQQEQPEQETGIINEIDSALANIPGSMGLSEFAAGVNRSAFGALDFLGPDTLNSILELGGSDFRVPTFTESLGAQKGSFVEGQAGQILGTAGELAGLAAGTGQVIRSAAQKLSPLLQSSETASRGLLRQAGQVTPLSESIGGALAGAGAEVGKEFGPTGELIGGTLAPFIASPFQAITGQARRALAGDIPEAAQDVIRAGEQAGTRVLTSDVVPPETFAAKTLQQLGEKLGPIGTGGARAQQQKSRQEVVENIAQEFGVALDSPLEVNIVKSLEKGIAERLNKASTIRTEAVDVLDTFGNVPVNRVVNAIDEQIAKQVRLRSDADPVIIERLNNLKTSIQNADFGIVKDLRSNLIDDIQASFKGEALPTKAGAPLQAVKSAIDKDLLSFAKASDRTAAGKWIRSNRMFADSLRKAKDTELKRLLTKGTETPENVGSILRGGKISELNRLQRFIGKEGRQAGKAAIIRDALSESGFFSGNVNPDRFVTSIQKPARQRAIGVFFKGNDKKEIDGMVRLLDATRRAQQASVTTPTGQQLIGLTAGAGAVANPVATFIGAATLAGSARAYESKLVRNALLRLSSTRKGSKAESKIVNQLVPSVLGALESTNTQEQRGRE